MKMPKIRKRWKINPRTRIKESNKIYKRKTGKLKLLKELEQTKNEENKK